MTQQCEHRIWAKYDSYACPKPAKYYYVQGKKIVHLCGTHRRVQERYHEIHALESSNNGNEDVRSK